VNASPAQDSFVILAAGEFDWATNVWQDPARAAAATVVLPPVTQ